MNSKVGDAVDVYYSDSVGSYCLIQSGLTKTFLCPLITHSLALLPVNVGLSQIQVDIRQVFYFPSSRRQLKLRFGVIDTVRYVGLSEG